MAFEVFISYASDDIRWRKKLEKHLSNLKNQQLIHAYYDGDVSPGKKIEDETLAHLRSAQIILLLISSNYMAADFCYQTELKQAIERHTARQARVIPVLLSPTDYENTPFAELAPLPTDRRPISKWRGQEDDAFLDVVKGIKRALADLQENIPTTQPVVETTPVTPIESTPKVTEGPAPIFHVPFERNPYFTGREAILKRLHENFASTRKAIQPQAIRGLGGVGKTQLATEYAYHFRAEYRYIFWVKANSHDLIVADYVNIANLLKLTLRENTDQMLTVAEVKEWLRTHANWLLILDNADDVAMVKSFIPSSQMGHILLTTRTPIVGTTIQEHELSSMSLDEGILFLLRRAKLLDREASLDTVDEQNQRNAAAIVEMMGALPLALAQAGAYIEETGCGLAGYIERYQKRRMKLLQKQGAVDHEPVATTWSLSFEQIERDNTAADLLRFCAFLHPDAIPEQLIVTGATALSAPLQAIAEDIFELDEAVEKLKRYSLVRRNDDGKTLNIHRLVQAVLKDNMDEETQQLWAERTVQAVNLAFPEPSTQTRQWCQQLIPHAQVCAELIKQQHMESAEVLHLLELAGQYLHEYGQYKDAESFEQQLLAIQEQLDGKEHLNVAHTLNTLGELARLQGHYQQAQTLYQRALFIRQQLLDSQHPDVATSLNSLARSYHHFAQYSQAAELYEQALAIREEMLGPLHPDVAHSLNDRAVLYNEQGKYQEALRFHLRALAIREEVLGPRHPDTATSLINLASVYLSQRKYQEALPLSQRSLTIREEVLGPQHPDTAGSLISLVASYHFQRKYQEALHLSQRALAICEEVLGPQHPDTAASLTGLALSYHVQGMNLQAIMYAKRALAINEKVLGANHPDVASSLATLAAIYTDQNNFKQAEPNFQKALSISTQFLEPEHPNIAMILTNYAHMLRKAKRNNKADEMEARAEAIRVKLGQEALQTEEG